VVVFAIFAVGATVAVVVLNAGVFGAAGFVRVYLDAIARGDATSALAMAGVEVPDDADPALLADDVLSGLSDIRQVADVATGDRHEVTVEWRGADGEGRTTFVVERTGTRFGLFPEWRFAETPIAVLDLAVLHDPRFTVNGVTARSATDSNEAGRYAVLAPGSYLLEHDTEFLAAEPVAVIVDQAVDPVEATLDVRADERFAEQVSTEVDDHLDECATQEVLFPSGCPFGQTIVNRVVSTPRWSIVEYPEIRVEPGPEFGTWLIPAAAAQAHLVVDVQSLFDGSVSTFDEDVPFDVGYTATIRSETELLIVADY
jgi:hypothetical protein